MDYKVLGFEFKNTEEVGEPLVAITPEGEKYVLDADNAESIDAFLQRLAEEDQVPVEVYETMIRCGIPMPDCIITMPELTITRGFRFFKESRGDKLLVAYHPDFFAEEDDHLILINSQLVPDTIYNYSSCYQMFSFCYNPELRFFGLPRSVVDMSEMFKGVPAESIILMKEFMPIDTSRVTNMSGMFEDCVNLKTLDLRGLDTRSVTNMDRMFKNCTFLQTINIDDWDLHNLKSHKEWFYGCIYDQEDAMSITGGSMHFPGEDEDDRDLAFSAVQISDEEDSFKKLDIFDKVDKKVIVGEFSIEEGNNDSVIITLSDGNIFTIDANDPMSSEAFIFSLGDDKVTPELIEHLNGRVVFSDETMEYLMEVNALPGMKLFREHYGDKRLVAYDPENFEVKYDILAYHGTKESAGLFSRQAYIVSATGLPVNLSSCHNMFTYSNFEGVIINWPINRITDLSGMFMKGDVYKVNLRDLSTNFVTTMENMFSQCSSLYTVNLPVSDMSKVVTMEGMFSECKKLHDVDLDKLDTSNVVNMKQMFFRCGLNEIDCSGWDVGNVRNMDQMFFGCNFHKIVLNGWNSPKLETAEYFMSYNSHKPVEIQGEQWRTSIFPNGVTAGNNDKQPGHEEKKSKGSFFDLFRRKSSNDDSDENSGVNFY